MCIPYASANSVKFKGTLSAEPYLLGTPSEDIVAPAIYNVNKVEIYYI